MEGLATSSISGLMEMVRDQFGNFQSSVLDSWRKQVVFNQREKTGAREVLDRTQLGTQIFVHVGPGSVLREFGEAKLPVCSPNYLKLNTGNPK